MHKFAPLLIIGILLVALVAVVAWEVRSDSETFDDLLADFDLGDSSTDGTGGSGFIEAEGVMVSAQLGGRVESVAVEEGDAVVEGDVLLVLDASTIEVQGRRAEAAVASAHSQLQRLKEGARSEQIRQAEAALAQAEAAHQGAEQSLRDAQDARESPRQLELEIGAAETALEIAEQQVLAAHAKRRAADELADQAESALIASEQGTEQQEALARASFQQAQDLALQAQMAVALADVDLDYAKARLALLRENQKTPLEQDALVDAAQAYALGAEAAVDGATARLELAKAGPSETKLRMAEAALAQAEAQKRMLELQLGMAEIVTPIDGTVLEVFADEGETVSPGTPLARVAQMSPLVITVYVSETEIGELEPGQSVEVTVDAYEDSVFDGEVVHIASEAEFTPKNVQTKEDRANLVYAVLVRVDNDDGDLRPGMPADVAIDTN